MTNPTFNQGGAPHLTADMAERRATTLGSQPSQSVAYGSAPAPQGVYDSYTAVLQQQQAAANAANQRNVASLVSGTFEQYGLGSLASKITQYAQAGMNASEIAIRLRQTPEYQQRFAAMGTLAKQGRAMSEAEYINLEQSYAQVLKASGLPKGFYDSYNDYAQFIANDVAPTEVAARAKAASDLVNSKDPSYVEAFQKYYGVGKGDLAAYFLDPGRATPLLERAAKAAQLGGEATNANLDINGNYAETLVDKGIGTEQARAAFSTTATSMAPAATLAGIDQQNVATTDLINSALNTDATSEAKVKGLASRERARFSGSNAGTQILNNNVSGSY